MNDKEPNISENHISILLVDDNKVNQFLGKKILRNLGIVNVEVASDGQSALALLREKDFTVLLTDVEMPGMNGYELTTAVRQLDDTKNSITIIALTANASEAEKEYALKNGMNDYLSKPYSPNDLQNVLRKHILDKNSFIITEFSTSSSKHQNPVKAIYGLFNNNKEDVKNLLFLLHQQLPENITLLRQAILDENWDEVFSNAHKLKSSTKLFNDEMLFTKIVNITEYARTRSQLELIPTLFEEFCVGIQSILVLINSELESL